MDGKLGLSGVRYCWSGVGRGTGNGVGSWGSVASAGKEKTVRSCHDC